MDKLCPKCGIVKPCTPDFWQKNKATKDGLQSYCKACQAQIARQYRAANQSRINQEQRERYKDSEYKAKRVAANNQWRTNNKEYLTTTEPQRVKKWRKNNPEKSQTLNRNYEARKHSAQGFHTAEDILSLYAEQEGLCVYCGIRLFQDYAVDHYIPLSKGGSNDVDNLLCACKSCNSSKSDCMPPEWIKKRGW